MNMTGNTAGDLMTNWMASGGVLSAQEANAADDTDLEIRNAAMSSGGLLCLLAGRR